MKRAFIVGTSTIAGLAAVLLANPDGTPSVASEEVASGQTDSQGGAAATGSTSTDSTSTDSTSTGSSGTGSSGTGSTSTGSAGTDAASSSTGTDGSYKGASVQVRNYGTLQVQVTVTKGKMTKVSVLQAPDWDRKSKMISSYAVPQLVSSALDSQSADVSYVSGATFTSRAFKQSLQAALAEAGLG